MLFYGIGFFPLSVPNCLYVTLCMLFAAAAAAVESAETVGPLAEYQIPRPVIGIVTQPYAPEWARGRGVLSGMDVSGEAEWEDEGGAKIGQPYVAASYVKFVEAAGALPAVIPHDATDEELEILLGRLNGVLFPGGGASLSPGHPYHHIGKRVLNYAIEANNRGDYFPIQFTCLGFELVMQLIAGDDADILFNTDAVNYPSTLAVTEVGRESRFFGCPGDEKRSNDDTRGECWGAEIAGMLAQMRLAMNSHRKGVSPNVFSKSDSLASFFTLVATAADRAGVPYVAMVEAKRYPFFATQWHPEKNAYEWSGDVPHTSDAVHVTSYFAEVLGREARRSSHAFSDMGTLNAVLFYNVSPTFTARGGGYFEQAYFFQPRRIKSNQI